MLYVLWQIFAFAVVIGAVALVFWDRELRERHGSRAKAVGAVCIALVLAAGAARAYDQWWGWLCLAAAAAVGTLAPRIPQSQG